MRLTDARYIRQCFEDSRNALQKRTKSDVGDREGIEIVLRDDTYYAVLFRFGEDREWFSSIREYCDWAIEYFEDD
jgi:hypothetical protein